MEALRTACALALGAFALACAGVPEGPPTPMLRPLPSPAGPASSLPRLSAAPGGDLVLSWVHRTGPRSGELRFARLAPSAEDFTPASIAARGEGWFLNWADTPGVTAGANGRLLAHWLQYLGEGTYAYGVRVALADEGDTTFGEARWLHEDRRPVEHGFVSVVPQGAGFAALWLDGRDGSTGSQKTTDGGAGHGHGGAMGLRLRRIDADGEFGPERLVDARVCDCCSTSLSLAPDGFLAAYRDRSQGEIRDVSVAELGPGGKLLLAPERVHDDGWFLEGCPVNGPVIRQVDERGACVWYTGAENGGRVWIAFRQEGFFGDPVQVDEGLPEGRVDLVPLPGGDWLVTWLEHLEGSRGEWRARVFSADGTPRGASLHLATVSTDRAAGFLVAAPCPTGAVFAWTDVEADDGPRVQTARLDYLP